MSARWPIHALRDRLPDLEEHLAAIGPDTVAWTWDDATRVEVDLYGRAFQVAIRCYDRTGGVAAEYEIGANTAPTLAERLVRHAWRLLIDDAEARSRDEDLIYSEEG